PSATRPRVSWPPPWANSSSHARGRASGSRGRDRPKSLPSGDFGDRIGLAFRERRGVVTIERGPGRANPPRPRGTFPIAAMKARRSFRPTVISGQGLPFGRGGDDGAGDRRIARTLGEAPPEGSGLGGRSSGGAGPAQSRCERGGRAARGGAGPSGPA